MTTTFNNLEPGFYAVQNPPQGVLPCSTNSYPTADGLAAGTCQSFARRDEAIDFAAQNGNHRAFEVSEAFAEQLSHIGVASDITPLPRFLSEAAAGL